MIDKMIVTVFSGVLIVILVSELLLCSLPFFRRLEYDAVCHKYTLEMDQNGGLTQTIQAKLTQELNQRGFKVEQIHGTESALFGAELTLYLVCSFESYRISPDLHLEEVELSLTYQSSTICRILKSYAAVP